MALDPSIALQAGQGVPQINPLGMATQAQGLLNSQASNRLTNITADTAQQGLAAKRTAAIGTLAGRFLSLPEDPKQMSDQDYFHNIANGVEQAVASGLVPRDQGQMWLNNLGQSQGRAHVKQMIAATLIQNMDPQGAISQALGASGTQDYGAGIQPTVNSSPIQRLMNPGMPTMASGVV